MKKHKGRVINVGGVEYSLVYSTPKKNKDLNAYAGYVELRNKHIVIDKTLAKKFRDMILFHELCHAVAEEVDTKRQSMKSENFVRNFSNIMWGALKSAKLVKE
jgi:Zn-dependent peptidase ImmA (M78 family)